MRLMGKPMMLAAVLVFGLMVTGAFGADETKIGVVDFQKVLQTSSAGKAAQAEINAEGKVMEDDLKKKGQDIEALEKKLEREGLVMSKEMREERQREIRIKINDFKALQKKYTNDFKALEAKMIRRIRKEVFDILREIGKEQGYSLILEQRIGGVVYAPEALMLTDLLVQRYNNWYAEQQNQSSTN